MVIRRASGPSKSSLLYGHAGSQCGSAVVTRGDRAHMYHFRFFQAHHHETSQIAPASRSSSASDHRECAFYTYAKNCPGLPGDVDEIRYVHFLHALILLRFCLFSPGRRPRVSRIVWPTSARYRNTRNSVRSPREAFCQICGQSALHYGVSVSLSAWLASTLCGGLNQITIAQDGTGCCPLCLMDPGGDGAGRRFMSSSTRELSCSTAPSS